MPNKDAKMRKRKRHDKNEWLKKHGRTAIQYKKKKKRGSRI